MQNWPHLLVGLGKTLCESVVAAAKVKRSAEDLGEENEVFKCLLGWRYRGLLLQVWTVVLSASFGSEI